MAVPVSKLPFMKLNPIYTGGGIAWQATSENCTLDWWTVRIGLKKTI
jgi:hypothetical protein